jgi:hypothetical protein
MAAHRIARDPQAEANRIGRVGHPEHQRISDRLDVLAADAWKLRLNGSGELLHELDRLLVSMRLRERGEARDVREQESGLGVP